MEEFIPLLQTTDTRKRIAVGADILTYFSDPTSSLECDDIGVFIDGIVPWMTNSNFKVSTTGLEIMCHVIERMRESFKPYLSSVLPPTVDRLGDGKDSVRNEARNVLTLLMQHVVAPNALFERLAAAFSHKNGRVREEMMYCLQMTLSSHGAGSITISRLLPHVVKLLGDPGAPVRDMAFNTLVEAYIHYGDRLRVDLSGTKYNVPPSKLPALLSKFDEAKSSGVMMPTATQMGCPSDGVDQTDRANRPPPARQKTKGIGKSRASSAPPVKRSIVGSSLPPKGSAARDGPPSSHQSATRGGHVKRNPSAARSRIGSASGQGAGSVDESYFFSAFEDCPKINIYSTRELDDTMNKIRNVIGSASNEWDKRVEMLRKIRSVVVAGGPSYDEFYPLLRQMEPALELSIKDLRSTVVREACVSVAYLSQELHHKVDHLCEMVLTPLLALIPNSVKVMSTSGMVCVRFIIQNTHHHKIIPLLVRELTTSKNKEIRKAVCEFLDQLVHTWPPHAMDRHCVLLGEGIKKGIGDADAEARAFARKAYWGYAEHFKEEADKLLNSLELSYRKVLQGEAGGGGMSQSNSSHGIHTSTAPAKQAFSRPPLSSNNLMTSSTSSLKLGGSSSGGINFKYGGAVTSTTLPRSYHHSPMSGSYEPSSLRGVTRSPPSIRDTVDHRASPTTPEPPSGFRSTSAIDCNAVRRAQARAMYASANRMRAGTGLSLPRPRRGTPHSHQTGPPSVTSPTDRLNSRSRARGTVSQSQPGSRSGSPSSRYNPSGGQYTPGTGTLGRQRKRSGIPRSTNTSREPSPSRYGGMGTFGTSPNKNRSRSISGADGPSSLTSYKPRQMMAEKMLQQSREAESALADALVTMPPSVVRSPRRRTSSGRPNDDFEADSETSSICSDRSYDSLRRNNDASWYTSMQHRTFKENWDDLDKTQDVSDIITSCASTHWSDRKEGLIALHSFLKGSQLLSGTELKRITEVFSKMFMDAHTKVFSLFLDALMQLIYVHKDDLHDWLHILVTRLLHKLGSDLLGSVQSKIHETLDITRSSFPCDSQFRVIMKFLVDPTQTPNNKVKLATLTYLKCLADVMERKDLASSTDTPIALAKILTWSADQKSVDLRRASSACFIALFNCNMTEFTNLLQQLPMSCQNTASQIIQSHLKRAASLDKSPSSLPPRTPPSGGSSVLQSPNTSLPRGNRPTNMRQLSYSGLSSNLPDLDNNENHNPDDVLKNIKKTSDEIRNYSFELDRENIDNHRDSTSQDSGISQLSVGVTDIRSLELMDTTSSNGGAEGGMPHEGALSDRSSSVSSPTSQQSGRTPMGLNGLHLDDDDVDQYNIGDGESDNSVMSSVIETLQLTNNRRPDEKKIALTTLVRLARTGSTIVWNDNFRAVLRLLVENLESSHGSERALVLTVLTEMMRRCPLVNLFLNYSELIILRVLKAHGDNEKEVVRAAQVCAGTVAEILPPEVVIRVLKPLIQMGDYPVNHSAIKMLNKLVEAHPAPIVAQALPDIMPGLVKAYDNRDSSVRKASVFCMVSLHNNVGEETMRPHLEALTGSKLKLLNLYIKKTDAQLNSSSGASSPKSEHFLGL